jgi:hypothetical protein
VGLFHRNAALKKVEEDVEVGQDFLKWQDNWKGALLLLLSIGSLGPQWS